MAENKIGPNLQAGAGFLAKRVQKSLNRAQEKVSQEKHPHNLSTRWAAWVYIRVCLFFFFFVIQFLRYNLHLLRTASTITTFFFA